MGGFRRRSAVIAFALYFAFNTGLSGCHGWAGSDRGREDTAGFNGFPSFTIIFGGVYTGFRGAGGGGRVDGRTVQAGFQAGPQDRRQSDDTIRAFHVSGPAYKLAKL